MLQGYTIVAFELSLIDSWHNALRSHGHKSRRAAQMDALSTFLVSQPTWQIRTCMFQDPDGEKAPTSPKSAACRACTTWTSFFQPVSSPIWWPWYATWLPLRPVNYWPWFLVFTELCTKISQPSEDMLNDYYLVGTGLLHNRFAMHEVQARSYRGHDFMPAKS